MGQGELLLILTTGKCTTSNLYTQQLFSTLSRVKGLKKRPKQQGKGMGVGGGGWIGRLGLVPRYYDLTTCKTVDNVSRVRNLTSDAALHLRTHPRTHAEIFSKAEKSFC